MYRGYASNVDPPWLNVGCGTIAPEGWVNIDRLPGLALARFPLIRAAAVRFGVLRGPQAQVLWPKGIERIDVRKRLPFSDGSVGVVYSSRMLEHLVRADAIRFLAECRRVLRMTGCCASPCRICTGWLSVTLLRPIPGLRTPSSR
jgi:hypothetical protein